MRKSRKSISLNRQVYERFKLVCQTRGNSMGATLEVLIINYLERRSPHG